MGGILDFQYKSVSYSPPPLQLQTFEGIPCVFCPSILNVFVIHSFCDPAHSEIGFSPVDISLMDFDTEIIEIEVKARDKVLNPAQIKYLLFSSNSLSISKNVYSLSTLVMI